MVNIKIICGCGQKYSFDVYPLNRRMPAPVQCPVCGLDGTAAANEILARLPEAPSAAPLATLNSPVSGNEVNQPMPDAVKDAWQWCRDLLGGKRGPRLPPAAEPLTAADGLWQQRALEAERRAEQALAATRAELAPHLAQALREALVQELAIQRKELLQAQQLAAAEIAQLAQHLDELKAPMQERLRSYEMRIQELEKELAARSEENRELLKLKIEMVRQQLEVERSRNRMSFN